MADETVPVDLDVPLSENPARKLAGVMWPRALDERLEYLVGLTRRRTKVDRQELAAAIVFAAPDNVKGLIALVEAYRDASTRDALQHLDTARDPTTRVIELPKRKPGPHTKAG